MYDITALGEVLVDFVSTDYSSTGARLFEQNAGGAPANVLCVGAKLGLKTLFMGKVGDDLQGHYLESVLKSQGVDSSGLIYDKNFFTTLAFVQLSESGERSFSFARNPGADLNLTKNEVDINLIKKSKIFHFGSLSLSDEPARSTTIYAVKEAKKAGAIISYDPNYREAVWTNIQEASDTIKSVFKDVDILKISEEELEIITGEKDLKKAAEKILAEGISCVVITLGEKGAMIATDKIMEEVKGFKSDVVDTTGAGDSFWGGFLYKILTNNVNPKDLTRSQAVEFLQFSNAVASLCVEKRGAIPAIPTLDLIEKRINKQI